MTFAGRFPSYERAKSGSSNSGTLSPMLQLRNFLRREWHLIAFIMGVSIILAATYAATSPFKYNAHADMMIDAKTVAWRGNEMASENQPVDDPLIESEIETTKSEKIAIAVASRLHLKDDLEFRPGEGLKHKLFALLKLQEGPTKPPSDDEQINNVVSILKSNLTVTRVGRSYVEQIAYSSLDPDKAAKIANAFADAYIENQLQAKFDTTRRSSEWLEQRISELRQQASEAFKAVQDFKSENSVIIGVDGRLASEVELGQLGIALAKARADTSQARAKLDRIMGVLEQRSNKEHFDIPDPIVTDALSSPVITRLRQQFLDDQNTAAEWSARYGPDHQAAKNLRAEMAALQRAIWDEMSRIAESYKSELQIATSQEEAIDKRMGEVFQQSGATRQLQVRLRELETAASSYRDIYATFLSRFTQSVQQQSFPSTKARIVTAATPPHSPSEPKTTLIVALAAISGLGLGLLGGFAREQLNRRIQTREQLEKLLQTPCLAVLPAFSKTNSSNNRRKATQDSSAFRKLGEVAPFSATAEALRHIKVAVDLHPAGAKIIGMVSALPGEGKTTVAAGFAAFVAKSGGRALLVDADLRNPSMTRALGYAKAPGLLNMVAEKSDFDDLVIMDLEFGFDFLPSATQTKTSNSSDVLNSPAMREMLGRASKDYDYVIVDLPPILPVVDVRAAAHLFDAFVLVVEWGSTSTNEILTAVNTSSTLYERLLGSVLNKADESVMRRFEGYSDRHYRYYQEEEAIPPKGIQR
jgi:polysaccharide biosynthesis transport protein